MRLFVFLGPYQVLIFSTHGRPSLPFPLLGYTGTNWVAICAHMYGLMYTHVRVHACM